MAVSCPTEPKRYSFSTSCCPAGAPCGVGRQQARQRRRRRIEAVRSHQSGQLVARESVRAATQAARAQARCTLLLQRQASPGPALLLVSPHTQGSNATRHTQLEWPSPNATTWQQRTQAAVASSNRKGHACCFAGRERHCRRCRHSHGCAASTALHQPPHQPARGLHTALHCARPSLHVSTPAAPQRCTPPPGRPHRLMPPASCQGSSTRTAQHHNSPGAKSGVTRQWRCDGAMRGVRHGDREWGSGVVGS